MNQRRVAILSWLTCAILGLSLHAAGAAAATSFPYIAYVAEADARVRSGPGEKHYATMSLPIGYAVEVYRHDDGGWCAIRPPEGSFSLIEASDTRIVQPGVAQMTRPESPSRVGSSLSDRQSAVQVLLGNGEPVEVLEPPRPGDRWMKIAPPAGEFRWIAARLLSASPPVESSPPPAPQESRWEAQSPHRTGDVSPATATELRNRGLEFRPRSTDDSTASRAPDRREEPTVAGGGKSDPLGQTGTNPSSSNPFAHLSKGAAAENDWPTEPRDGIGTNDIELVDGSPAAVKLAQTQGRYREHAHQRPAWPGSPGPSPPDGDPSPPASPAGPPPVANSYRNAAAQQSAPSAPAQPAAAPAIAAAPPRMRFPGSGATQAADARIFELQLRLSQLIVKPPAEWQLGQMRSDVSALLAEIQHAEQRQTLEAMLRRIATFEQAQVRYTRPWTLGAPTGAPQLGSTTTAAADGQLANGATPLAMSGGQADEIRRRVRSDLAGGGSAPTVADNDITPTPADPFVGAMPGETTARYDAVGTLKPVVSKREQAPRYALVDDDGQVIAFLTPTPEMNLQRFVGKRIGVNGSRGFMPEFRRAHVTASRVTPLEGGSLR